MITPLSSAYYTKIKTFCLTLWNQSIIELCWCLPPNCECEENWDDIRSEVNWWRLYIFIMFQSHRSPHINISVFILIALLHGMLTVCVLGYNKGCISEKAQILWCQLQYMMILFYQAVLENVIRYGMRLWYGNLTVQLKYGFKYLGVNISEDLTWTTHIQTQVKKARQRLYHLRQLRKFRVSPVILKLSIQGP